MMYLPMPSLLLSRVCFLLSLAAAVAAVPVSNQQGNYMVLPVHVGGICLLCICFVNLIMMQLLTFRMLQLSQQSQATTDFVATADSEMAA